MFKRILFPTDFSSDRNQALHHALATLDVAVEEVIVQHVVNNFFGPHAHWASLFDVHELQKEMDFHVETEIAGALDDATRQAVSFRPVIVQGKPAEEICKLAHQEMVDLIVMGSTMGVATMKVARAAARPLLAIPVRGGAQPGGDGSSGSSPAAPILVATDFSRQAKKVTDFAFEMKKLADRPIRLAYAVKTPAGLHRLLREEQVEASLAKSRQWAETRARSIIPHEFINDPSVGVHVGLGATSDFILNTAAEIDPSVIVMGAKEYGPVEQRFYGTTVDKVLKNTRHPVLTLKL